MIMALVGLSFICCSKAQNGTTAIVAHRGFWNCEAAGYSENSIASLKAAQENGFWGSECDVQLTADNIAMINHDPHIGLAKISNHSYAELKDSLLPNGEHRPTFDEYLAQAATCKTTKLIIEVKPQNDDLRDSILVSKIINSLKEQNMYSPERVGFISFSLYTCKLIARIAPEFLNQYLNGELSPSSLDSLGINGLDYRKGILIKKHPEWIEQAHSLGMSTNAWTVNKEDEIQKLIDLKVGAITSNEPLLVRQLLGDKEIKN